MFYCVAYSSYQKGAIEENHVLIRYVLAKGTYFDFITQKEMTC
jgi:IS30 family transposase